MLNHELYHQAVSERLHALRQEAALARLIPQRPTLLARLWSHLRSHDKPDAQPTEAQTT